MKGSRRSTAGAINARLAPEMREPFPSPPATFQRPFGAQIRLLAAWLVLSVAGAGCGSKDSRPGAAGGSGGSAGSVLGVGGSEEPFPPQVRERATFNLDW